MDWVRPKPNGGMRNYTEVFSNEIGGKMGGYVTGVDINNGTPARAVGPADKPLHTMSGVRLTAELRELERNNVVNEMHANPGRVSDYPAQTVDGKTYPAVEYRGDYGTFIVLFDPATSLPAVVRTRDFDVIDGDSNYDETLSDWRDIGRGVKMPFHQLITINGLKIFDTTLTEALRESGPSCRRLRDSGRSCAARRRHRLRSRRCAGNGCSAHGQRLLSRHRCLLHGRRRQPEDPGRRPRTSVS